MRITLVLAVVLALALSVRGEDTRSPGENFMGKLRPEHPRLIVSQETWDHIRDRRKSDTGFDALVTSLEADAAALIDAEPVKHEKIGARLLSVSREALRRIMLLSFVYNLNHNDAYLKRAEAEMRAVMAFKDWNPTHFLDVGEMAAAVAVGYDWLYERLDPGFRAEIRATLWDKALKFPFDPEWVPKLWWMRGNNNWNSVCYGGLTMAMLVAGEDDPARADEWFEMVRKGNPLALEVYAPDGVYPEGPGYWTYGTTYQVMLIAALESALGDDMGLSEAPGFLETGAYPMLTTGPSGLSFNYSDGGAGRRTDPALFWFAKRTDRPSLAAMEINRDWAGAEKSRDRLLPLAAIWWAMLDADEDMKIDLPLAWRGRGEQPIAIFRSSWTDPDALFLATKGGSASLPHGHMDAGAFVLDLGGLRWAADLGSQNYNSLESKGINLWGRKQDSGRWSVYRIGSSSHNTLTIDGQPHRVDGHATMTDFSDGPGALTVSYDLSPVFEGYATHVVRTFRVESERAVSVQDELQGLKPGAVVRWAMLTPAEIELKGDAAVLAQSGQTLTAKLVEPAGATFEWITADPPHDYDAPNPGYQILIAKVKTPESGQLRIEVHLALASARGN